jgi:predicted AlkP superfamily pyrophosphatase or phosphodiesterase
MRSRLLRAAGIAVVATIVHLSPPDTRLAAQTQAPPKLVVLLVVDQMRADYLEWYGANFTAGLRRLTREGAWFTQAAYPYLNTVTCPGHSTIGTGTFPYHHGMILNNWYDRTTGKSPYCTDDPDAKEISYNNLSPVQGDSAKLMMRPALGEQIMARGGRAVGLSFKPRSAVTLTGHTATAVLWFDDRGGWTTSSIFSPAPVPFLQKFIDSNPITNDLNKVWDRSLPLTAYQGEDDVKAEGIFSGGTRTFPHAIGIDGKADTGFYSRWQRSPFADEYLERMAETTIETLKLGRGANTDFLAISFSSVDAVGHIMGPRSHEVQDLLARLDKTMGRLLAYLDTNVGAGNYVLGLSADHGVAEIPETVGKGGRIASKTITSAVQGALEAAMGAGKHVANTAYTDIVLSDEARQRLTSDEKLRTAALTALRSIDGITTAFWGADLATEAARHSDDPVRRAAALSYYPGRSGDLVVVPGENWLLSTSVTTHGTLYPYDQRVPVIVFGKAIKPGRYSQAATPADLVPTLASVAKVTIAPTDGRVLREALVAVRP